MRHTSSNNILAYYHKMTFIACSDQRILPVAEAAKMFQVYSVQSCYRWELGIAVIIGDKRGIRHGIDGSRTAKAKI